MFIILLQDMLFSQMYLIVCIYTHPMDKKKINCHFGQIPGIVLKKDYEKKTKNKNKT